MDDWKEVWSRKGKADTMDLKWLNGYEERSPDPKFMVECLSASLELEEHDRLLDVGCGAGYLSRYLTPLCRYFGVDMTESLIDKHMKALPDHRVSVAEATDIPYPDGIFDKVMCFGVCHYFPDLEYFVTFLREAERLLRPEGLVFVGDLPRKSSRTSHLLFEERWFQGVVSRGLYPPNDTDRFNILMTKEDLQHTIINIEDREEKVFTMSGSFTLTVEEETTAPDSRKAVMVFFEKHGFLPEGVEGENGSWEDVVGLCEVCGSVIFDSDEGRASDSESGSQFCPGCADEIREGSEE